jgi:hypothetical protein
VYKKKPPFACKKPPFTYKKQPPFAYKKQTLITLITLITLLVYKKQNLITLVFIYQKGYQALLFVYTRPEPNSPKTEQINQDPFHSINIPRFLTAHHAYADTHKKPPFAVQNKHLFVYI